MSKWIKNNKHWIIIIAVAIVSIILFIVFRNAFISIFTCLGALIGLSAKDDKIEKIKEEIVNVDKEIEESKKKQNEIIDKIKENNDDMYRAKEKIKEFKDYENEELLRKLNNRLK
jgi:peptidoglycan hydrolase CwlO-like protein